MQHEVVIFCNQNDQVANSLFRQLLNHGHSVLLVTASELAFAQWKHIIDDAGKCKTEIILPGGSIIHSGKLRVAFNRIRFLPMLQFVNETDRNYAEMEIFAVYISFLKGINHLLINPVQTNYITIEEDNELLFKMQAVEAGMPVTDYHFTSSPKWQHTLGLLPFAPQTPNTLSSYKKSPNLIWENKPLLFKERFNKVSKLTVVGKRIFGNNIHINDKAINKFMEYIGTPFFELQMVQIAENYKLETVNRFPVFGDSQVIDALESLIEQKRSVYL